MKKEKVKTKAKTKVKAKKKKKKSKIKKIILWSISILLISLLGIGGYGVYYINSMLNKVEKVEVKKENLSIDIKKEEKYVEIKNIALFGIDGESDENGRSDVIMILTLDSEHDKIKLTSIMRDSYVDIPGYGMDKLNHAYAYGGPELAIKTLNENFGLNIKEFMTVNFSSMPKIIDKLGGVSIEVTDEELKHINSYIVNMDNVNGTKTPSITSAGLQELNGTQATAYSRIRYTNGDDYKRTERQRTVINGLFEKASEISITKYPALINEFLPFISTNMSSTEMLTIAKNFAFLLDNGLTQSRYPLDEQAVGQMINGVSYITFDIEELRNHIDNYIFEDKIN